jgi:hypothetical protein
LCAKLTPMSADPKRASAVMFFRSLVAGCMTLINGAVGC